MACIVLYLLFPSQDTVVLGGTHQEGDWNTEVYPEDREFIKTGCFHLIPSLKVSNLVQKVTLHKCRLLHSYLIQKETFQVQSSQLKAT